MQFSTCEEHVQLVERAKALLARSKPGMTLGELHHEALRLLVASLEKRKFAVTDRPRKRAASHGAPQQALSPSGPGPALDAEHIATAAPISPSRRGLAHDSAAVVEPIETVAPVLPSRGGLPHDWDAEPNEAMARPREPVTTPSPITSREPAPPREPAPRQRGRYVPAAERREVFTRDGARCTFTDEEGRRCCETRYLELHHRKPFAHGGENVAANLTLRSAHNALAAEEDFGRDIIEQKRGSTRHESAQSMPRRDLAS
jgi:5-methylcytosine-specific restriction endonuclease McrA